MQDKPKGEEVDRPLSTPEEDEDVED